MKNRFGILGTMFLIILLTLFYSIQKADAVLITFENDVTTPRNQYDSRMLSLTSVDSPLAHFNVDQNSLGGLIITSLTQGGNKFMQHVDDQGFGINITFDVLLSSISIDYFGRGDPQSYTNPNWNTAHFFISNQNLTLPIYSTFHTFSYSGTPFNQLYIWYDYDSSVVWTSHTNEMVCIDNVNFTPVPEPATMLLLGSGLIGLAGYGRKKLFKK